MKLYSIEMTICGTMYVHAENEAEALRKAKAAEGTALYVANARDEPNAYKISGRRFNDPELPDSSFSPAMTILGVRPKEYVEEVEG